MISSFSWGSFPSKSLERSTHYCPAGTCVPHTPCCVPRCPHTCTASAPSTLLQLCGSHFLLGYFTAYLQTSSLPIPTAFLCAHQVCDKEQMCAWGIFARASAGPREQRLLPSPPAAPSCLPLPASRQGRRQGRKMFLILSAPSMQLLNITARGRGARGMGEVFQTRQRKTRPESEPEGAHISRRSSREEGAGSGPRQAL